MAARFNNNTAAAEGLHLCSELVQRFFISHRNDRTEAMKRPRSGNPAPRQTDDCYSSPSKIFLHYPLKHFSRLTHAERGVVKNAENFSFLRDSACTCVITRAECVSVVNRLYLSFSVLIEINARMIPIIQNRVITFDSGQPICSK